MPGALLEQKPDLKLTGGQRVYLWFKWRIDILLSGVCLIVFSPVFPGVIAAIKLEDG